MEPIFYEHRVVIDTRDVDGLNHCRPSALLGHLQEAATVAAEHGGFGRERLLKECRGFWMLSRMWFRLERPLHWGEELLVRTWHRGDKGAVMYRDFDLFVEGALVGEAVSAWVLADVDTHKLIRLGTIPLLDATGGGALCKEKRLAKLRLPKEMAEAERRKMHYSDTDLNGHVNNTRYADFACDALELHQLPPDCFLSAMQLDYIGECRPGEELSLMAGAQDGAHFVKGVDNAGKIRFETQLIFGKVLS